MKIEAKINWDELFMGIAALASFRSKDPSTKHGACIVNDEHRIVSIGYNGMPRGDDQNYTWNREDDADGFNKYHFALHSEENAILNAPDRQSLKNSIIYIYSPKGYYPCTGCMRLLVQSKIREIVLSYAMDADTDKYNWKPTLHMKKVSGIIIRSMGKVQSKESFLKIAKEFTDMAAFL